MRIIFIFLHSLAYHTFQFFDKCRLCKFIIFWQGPSFSTAVFLIISIFSHFSSLVIFIFVIFFSGKVQLSIIKFFGKKQRHKLLFESNTYVSGPVEIQLLNYSSLERPSALNFRSLIISNFLKWYSLENYIFVHLNTLATPSFFNFCFASYNKFRTFHFPVKMLLLKSISLTSSSLLNLGPLVKFNFVHISSLI